jgi:hypothetical protein
LKGLFLIVLILFSLHGPAQDLTGTWEGEFTSGTTGLRQTAKMELELVEVEGRLYGIFRLFPIDTRKDDQPNVVYTVEGDRGKDGKTVFALYKGRIVESNVPEMPREFFQFTLNYKKEKEEMLSGKWFYELEPINSKEKGAGTFRIRKINNDVSDLLKGRKKEKEILQKID